MDIMPLKKYTTYKISIFYYYDSLIMSQINQLLQGLSKHSDVVKKFVRPLIHLGIMCFYYVHIKNNGDYVILIDNPHIDEYYFDKKLYIKDPYIRHPNNL